MTKMGLTWTGRGLKKSLYFIRVARNALSCKFVTCNGRFSVHPFMTPRVDHLSISSVETKITTACLVRL